MNIALTDDLQRLLRKEVENGAFPNEEAVVEEALRVFLIKGPDKGKHSTTPAIAPPEEKAEDARPWRGVYTLEFPDEVLFTKPIDIRSDQFGEWQSKGVTEPRVD